MTDTNIADEHRRAFNALTSGQCENFCLFSCTANGIRQPLSTLSPSSRLVTGPARTNT